MNKRKMTRIVGSTKLDRAVARNNMKKAGYTQLNKKEADGTSKFSKMWRDFVY